MAGRSVVRHGQSPPDRPGAVRTRRRDRRRHRPPARGSGGRGCATGAAAAQRLPPGPRRNRQGVTPMHPFTIAVPDDELDELRSRLRRTRFAVPTAKEWGAGTDPDYLRSLVSYWAEEFDWRAAEARLNAYPQYVV